MLIMKELNVYVHWLVSLCRCVQHRTSYIFSSQEKEKEDVLQEKPNNITET